MPRHFIIGVVAAGLAAGLSAAPLVAADGPYTKIAEIQIGGAPNFDYLNLDPAAHRLYVSHGAEVVVIDTAANTIVGRITDTPGVHGIALAPALGRGFTSNGTEAKVSIVDLKTLATIGKVDTGRGPDAIMYDPARKEVYAFNSSGSATVIDAAKGTVVATIPLDGKPESGQSDPALGRVFVNIESGAKGSTIAVIDTATHTVVANWPVAPAEEPTGLALDTTTHRLFSGGGPSVVMVDAKTGKVVTSAAICMGTDATWFDPGTKMVFSSCNDGRISAFKEAGDALTPVQTIESGNRARTMTLDPMTHNLYVCATTMAPPDPANPSARPRPLPDSLHVVVLGMK